MKKIKYTNISDFLSLLPGFEELSTKSHILLLGYYLKQVGLKEFSAKQLKSLFNQVLLPVPKQLPTRLYQLSRGRKSPLLWIKEGRYSLSIYGCNEVKQYLKKKPDALDPNAYLKKVIDQLKHNTERKFLAEAISCLSVDAKRATVIMTWLLAMSHLQEYILRHKIKDFNQAYLARKDNTKKLQVSSKDDFLEIKEVNFIEICRAAKIISNDVRKILVDKLGVRNTCAHPSDIVIHDTKVINVIEDLVDNVILKYGI